MNSKLDILFVTPPSRLEVYQDLSNEYAAIEPPVWSSLIAKYMMIRNYNVKILHLQHIYLQANVYLLAVDTAL